MTKDTIIEEFKRYAAANLNDGEFPIPEEGRTIQLAYAIEVLSDFIPRAYEVGRKEREGEIREMIEIMYAYTPGDDLLKILVGEELINWGELRAFLNLPTPEERTSPLPPNE